MIRVGVALPVYDALEQTQDIVGEHDNNGVFRWQRGAYRRAPELSERYPVVPINTTRRQAE